MLEQIKVALRVTSNVFDSEINALIAAAKSDLAVAGVDPVDETDALVIRAVTTYCKANFGNPDNYDKLKASYDEQKAQLATNTGHTVWSSTE